MVKRTSFPTQRCQRRAAVLAGATLGFSLSGSLAAHADGGVLGGATEVVGETTEQVPPVVETVQSTAPEPVEQVVEQVVAPIVPPADAPPDAERAVEEVVTAVEQAAEPVDRVVEPASSAPEPAVSPAEPVVQPAPGGPRGEVHHDDAVDRGRHGHRAFRAVARTLRPDRAPRRINRPATLLRDDEDVEVGAGRSLWELTYDLMRLSAGHRVPGAVEAGLGGEGPTGARRPGAAATAPLLLGLLLACLSLVLARRRLG